MPPRFASRLAFRPRVVVPAVLGVALLASAGTGALASGWSAPQLLSGGGNGFGASDAIDSKGNALAVWFENLGSQGSAIEFADHARRGPWKSADLVPPSSGFVASDPIVHETNTGAATAVWSTGADAWSADRPAGGTWTTPQLVLSGIAGLPAFTMNSNGSAVLAAVSGACAVRDTGNCTIMTATRPAGGAWGQPVSAITTSNRLQFDSVAIGNGGDAVATWETFDASCNQERCVTSNFVLFAARQPAGTTNWQVGQAALAGPDPVSHVGAVSLDAKNRAAVFINSQTNGITVVTQASGGQTFSAPTTVTTDTDIAFENVQSDPAGDTTLVGLQGSAQNVVAVSGNFDSNKWNSVATLSTATTDESQSGFPVAFAVGAKGESVAAWAQGATAQATADDVVVSVSPSPGAPWSAPVTIAGNVEFGLPQSVSVSSDGRAVLTYFDLSGTDADEIRGTVYNPR
ncbi:MAG TPA: hypothetical protein VKR31_01085 [Rhizomicrobium sp.]|nr:hypothetical protein [Rhizomicrobium sp.]